MFLHTREWKMVSDHWPLTNPQIKTLREDILNSSLVMASMIAWGEAIQKLIESSSKPKKYKEYAEWVLENGEYVRKVAGVQSKPISILGDALAKERDDFFMAGAKAAKALRKLSNVEEPLIGKQSGKIISRIKVKIDDTVELRFKDGLPVSLNEYCRLSFYCNNCEAEMTYSAPVNKAFALTCQKCGTEYEGKVSTSDGKNFGVDFRRTERKTIAGPILDCCIFCLTCRGNLLEGSNCTYDFHHEFPTIEVKPKQKEKKPDANRCQLCGLHRLNPAGQTNGCKHEYMGKPQ